MRTSHYPPPRGVQQSYPCLSSTSWSVMNDIAIMVTGLVAFPELQEVADLFGLVVF